MEVSLVGYIFGWSCLWLEVGGRVLQGEAKKGQGQLKKVATDPKISILPLFGWRCLWLEGRGRVLQGEAKRDKDGWYVLYCIILFRLMLNASISIQSSTKVQM